MHHWGVAVTSYHVHLLGLSFLFVMGRVGNPYFLSFLSFLSSFAAVSQNIL